MAAQLQLAVILPFVTGALQGLGEQRRSVAIVRSLRRAGNLAARAELVQCKQRYTLAPQSFLPIATLALLWCVCHSAAALHLLQTGCEVNRPNSAIPCQSLAIVLLRLIVWLTASCCLSQ